ncbi:MAG TPA: hypothetical protein VFA37_10810 [Gaiellaceae bacterium]|nr:hypothetical protein [Gaiellaceae bacterium]
MARRKPKTLLEVNVLLAAASLMTEEQRATKKRLPLMDQARLMVQAMPKASRVGELIAMWTITKYQEGEVSVDRLAEVWGEPRRTMYRKLEEFRECWSLAGFETPDRLADALIAEYRRRNERLTAGYVGKLLATPLALPTTGTPVQFAT